VKAHLLFSEGQCALLLAFAAPLQKLPAQQREFLHPDAISRDQSHVYSNRKLRLRSIGRNAFKCEYAEFRILIEPH
jgi:hypothetical protein